MQFPQKYRRIAIPAVIVLLLAAGYWYIATKTPPSDSGGAAGNVSSPESAPLVNAPNAATTTGATAGDAVVNNETLSLLTDLREVSLGSSVFSSAAFQSLVDFEVVIPELEKGRVDPFAPIGANTELDALNDTTGNDTAGETNGQNEDTGTTTDSASSDAPSIGI